LSRNLHHLTSLLRQGQVRTALEYRQMLDTLRYEVRSHLRPASSVLAAWRPASQSDLARAGCGGGNERRSSSFPRRKSSRTNGDS